LFGGAEATANLQAAESAGREALVLAGVDPDASAPTVDSSFPAPRRSEIAADCYTLLLVLASLRSRESGIRGQEALRILDCAGRLGFQTRAYHVRRAHVLEHVGQRDEARQERERADSLPPESALDHFLLGEELYRRGECTQAMNSFDRALALQPGHFWAQFFLAVCHLKVQHWEAAKAGLNGCLTQQPEFVWAYLFRSFANERLGA